MDIVGISQNEQVFVFHEYEFSFFLARIWNNDFPSSYLSASP